MSMKFITTRDEAGVEEVFVFPERIHHDAMAEMLGRIKNQTHGDWHRVMRKPVAAGFVNDSFECHGMSETLKLSARAEDTLLLAKQRG
jgi:hypothetical protein